MSWTTLAHVTTGALGTATFINNILDDLVVLKISVDDNGHVYDPVIQSKTANYTIVGTDDLVICSGASNFTITLLTAAGRAGKQFKVKQVGTGVITMATTSAQTIDGASAGLTTLNNGDSLTFESDGSNWVIV